jgi:hypothetical protein
MLGHISSQINGIHPISYRYMRGHPPCDYQDQGLVGDDVSVWATQPHRKRRLRDNHARQTVQRISFQKEQDVNRLSLYQNITV